MPKSHLKQNLLGFLRKQPNADARRAAVEKELINAESALGRTLFGDVAPGHQREFFMHKKNVWIWHEDGMTSLYAHLSYIYDLAEGETVLRRQPIGKVGQTGLATGPHLHFEIKVNGEAQDPEKYIKG